MAGKKSATHGWYIHVSGLNAARENQKWFIAITGANCSQASGPVLAQRILEYRQMHGGFVAVQELLQVEGLVRRRLRRSSH